MSSPFGAIIPKKNFIEGGMKTRKKEYGNSNLIGKRVEELRKKAKFKQKDFIAKLQLENLDINPASYSKLEGQIRAATDKEVFVIAKVLQVDISELFKDGTQ